MHVVFTTFGSFGDIHPYIAVGLGFQARGHRVTVATSVYYQEKIESEGLLFHPVRPDLYDFGEPEEVMRKAMDLRTGTEYIIREIFSPYLRESYEDIDAAAEDADILVTHPAAWAGPIVAAKRQSDFRSSSGSVSRPRLKWASTILSPLSLLSATDPPVFPPSNAIAALVPLLRPLGPGFHRVLYRLLRKQVEEWSAPIHKLRAELGLPRNADPIMEGANSPSLVLALFSRCLAAPQSDWPANLVQTGFPFYDRLEASHSMPSELVDFLAAGAPPIVFTLGTAAVMDAGDFYMQSAGAAQRLGRRAVLLIGRDVRNRPTRPLPDGIIALEYAPYSELFPHAAAIVHQGGVGTTGQAMRAGKPMLVMPYSHDQPDNAARVTRLGIARTIPRSRYQSTTASAELSLLLNTPSYAQKATRISQEMATEHGVEAACDALEAL